MPEHAAIALVGLDWGTTSLRAHAFSPAGEVLDSRERPWGIRQLPPGGFAGALAAIAGDWLGGPASPPAIACGMVGSRDGWREVPYVECPADVATVARGLVSVDTPSGPLHLVPGLRQGGDRPDVMRGEETQLAGAVAAGDAPADAVFILPGTHAKWVTIEGGRVTRFTTHLTGELFALLRDHSLLGVPAKGVPGRALTADGITAGGAAAAGDAFDRGLATARASGPAGLSGRLFTTRSLFLTGSLAAADTLDYLSGLLVGEEIRSGLAEHGDHPATICLVGDARLCFRYARGLAAFGASAVAILGDTAPAGLWQIARAARLVSDSDVSQSSDSTVSPP
jgi:2-dehydro-3-deoxygalactonokinase